MKLKNKIRNKGAIAFLEIKKSSSIGFVKNPNSVKDQEWFTSDKYPGLRWKFLVDADFNGSKGLSCGFAELLPGGNLTLHHHEPDEIYVVTHGSATL